jgi:hypothetical protein
MKISESRLKQIVKEETNKVLQEMDSSLGFLIGVGGYALYKGIAFLIAYFGEYKKGQKVGAALLDIDYELLNKYFDNNSKIKEILKKFADSDDEDNVKIVEALDDGYVEKAANLIQNSGKLSEEDLKYFNRVFSKFEEEKQIKMQPIYKKYGFDDEDIERIKSDDTED